MTFSKQEVGMLAFVAGLFIALFLALVQPGISVTTQILALGLIGISIGVLNVETHEVEKYMLASVALIVAAGAFAQVLDQLPSVSGMLERFLANILYIVVPGAVLVSLKIIYEASKSVESMPSALKAWKPARKAAKKRGKR